MTSETNLEIKGNLREFPLAELLVEISQVRLNGSLRLSCESQKTVVYLDAGEVIFAVSNARVFRLFEMLLRDNKITKEQLVKLPNFTNDFLLGQNLLKDNSFSKPEVDALFVRQIQDTLKNGFDWLEGNWTFSPLVRVKGGIRFKIGLNQLLIEYARGLSDEAIVRGFKDLKEVFSVKPAMPAHINLSPQESFVFSRFESSGLTVENAKFLSGMPDSETFKILYSLWLGGFLNRQNSKSAFSDRKTLEILSASISLIKEQKPVVIRELEPIKNESQKTAQAEIPVEKNEPIDEKPSLDGYLARVENDANFYEILDVEPEAAQTKIKQAYFTLAKHFHPDLFHREADTLLQQRVQQAFGKLAQAYDTLRYEKSREVYNFKIRKELEKKEARGKTNFGTDDVNLQKQFEQASDDFEQGFSLLMEEEFEAAVPYLARAVHSAKDNARYHAYYGKALASDSNRLHKAEAELQTAIKLDEGNPDFRIMLAEFFIQVGFLKRADGELNRLLTAFPGNQEAKILLDSLQKK